MKKRYGWIGGIGLIALLMVVTPATAQAQQAGKIGFVNVEEILATSDSGKSANEEFKKFYERNKLNIQTREQELRKLKDELEKQRTILTEQALKEKDSAYQKKFRDYQDMVKDANDDLNTRRQDLYNKYIPDILKIIKEIGEKEQYTMIVDTATVPVAYHNKQNNLTKRVIEQFNTVAKKK